jgi:hypothetical protein
MMLGNVEQRCIFMWEKAFIPFLIVDLAFTKAAIFTEFSNGKLAIKQVLDMCLKYYLFQ